MPYAHAPITEAVIEIRSEHADDIVIENLRFDVAGDYSEAELIHEVESEVRVVLGEDAHFRSNHIGFKFASQDGKYVFQSRQGNFVFSRLEPYESWEPFRDEARRLWDLYRAATCPTRLTRLAVRYINRFDIPGPRVELGKYFRTLPVISPALPQKLRGYFMQLRLLLDSVDAELLLNQTIVPPSRPGVSSVVLDFDYFRVENIPTEEDEIWAFFDTLRETKNEVFESCITDTCRGLIA